MKIAVIEDEKHTAEYLCDILARTDTGVRIVAILDSVASGREWFAKNEMPDLIFSDIQLGDGLCFEIFKDMQSLVPVVFCTAYDEYALAAFRANGIGYVLKPYDEKAISAELEKFHRLKEPSAAIRSRLESLLSLYPNANEETAGSLLVYQRDKILPVRFKEVALIFIENEITHVYTFAKAYYTISKTMDEVERLSGPSFFRVNRQFLVNREAIKEASQYFSRTLVLSLTIPFTEKITVSKNRVGEFLNWLEKGR